MARLTLKMHYCVSNGEHLPQAFGETRREPSFGERLEHPTELRLTVHLSENASRMMLVPSLGCERELVHLVQVLLDRSRVEDDRHQLFAVAPELNAFLQERLLNGNTPLHLFRCCSDVFDN